MDPGFLGLMEREGLQFVMEVPRRTLADIKGGPLIRYTGPDGRGRLMLLERTQVETEHLANFGDLQRFDVFNTNTLWWRLDVMLDRLRQGALELPMIVNPKTVQGVEVMQLETAMGAAVGSFERAAGVHVPRSRFAPVKATPDLLVVRSDAYRLDPEDHAIRPSPDRPRELVGPPVVRLDDRYYKGLPDLDARIPEPPSLVACRSLTIEGDVRLGAGVRMEGDVVLRNRSAKQKTVPDGTVLRDETREL